MPELPEVESTARDLRRWAAGRRLERVTVPAGRHTRGMSAARFRRILQGRSVEEVSRRGKWILVRLSGGAGFGIHLGMTGELVHSEGRERVPYSRTSFQLHGGGAVHFADARRFGRLVATERYEDLLELPGIAGLGPDAFGITAAALRRALRSRRPIKAVLLDQSVLSGLGNIYAADALFRARIHPMERADRVGEDAASRRRLAEAIRWALKQGLARWDGSPAEDASEEALYPGSIYGRSGKPCPRCGRALESMTLAGRSTVFCGRCQARQASRR